jgi:hypothetical protein
MRRGLTIAVSALVVAIVLFVVGFFIGSGSNLATIRIQNRSSRGVATARVEFDQGTRLVSSIESRNEEKAVWYTRRQTDYRLIVTFEDGRTIRSDERRIEPGAEVTEIVTDSVIVRAY